MFTLGQKERERGREDVNRGRSREKDGDGDRICNTTEIKIERSCGRDEKNYSDVELE